VKTVLYVCLHNAGRSQMAEAFTNHLARERGLPIRALSAGTIAGEKINPIADQVMREAGVSMDGQAPKQLTQHMADQADRIITMGCGIDADACPARIHLSEDWGSGRPRRPAYREGAGNPRPDQRTGRGLDGAGGTGGKH
jgi:Protein-tyrosine-phosphatase